MNVPCGQNHVVMTVFVAELKHLDPNDDIIVLASVKTRTC